MKVKHVFPFILYLLAIFNLLIWFSACTSQSTKFHPKEQKVISTLPKGKEQKETKDNYLSRIKWYADTSHSSIQFRTRHSGVYDVIGWIQNFEIVMEGQRKDFTDVSVEASADIRSVKMPNMGMAGNLQGLFNTETFPKVFFKSKDIQLSQGNTFQLIGDMTIKEITRELRMDVQFNGFGSPLSFALPGFTVDGKFNRHDFGIGEPEVFSEYRESPHPMIGDTIFFRANLRFYFED